MADVCTTWASVALPHLEPFASILPRVAPRVQGHLHERQRPGKRGIAVTTHDTGYGYDHPWRSATSTTMQLLYYILLEIRSERQANLFVFCRVVGHGKIQATLAHGSCQLGCRVSVLHIRVCHRFWHILVRKPQAKPFPPGSQEPLPKEGSLSFANQVS